MWRAAAYALFSLLHFLPIRFTNVLTFLTEALVEVVKRINIKITTQTMVRQLQQIQFTLVHIIVTLDYP